MPQYLKCFSKVKIRRCVTSSQSFLLSACKMTALQYTKIQIKSNTFYIYTLHWGSRSEREVQFKIVLFPIERCDLEAEPPILAVHCHDGAVIDVQDQTSGYGTTRLAHEVSSLSEEVLTVPGGWNQTGFTGGEKHSWEIGTLADGTDADENWCGFEGYFSYLFGT